MKYEENFTESKVDVVSFFKKVVPDSFVDQLAEGGVKFEFPATSELEYKVKYDISEEGGSCSIKVSWDNDLFEDDDDDDDDEKED